MEDYTKPFLVASFILLQASNAATAHADVLFRLVERLDVQEVRPRQQHRTSIGHIDYYVSNAGVDVTDRSTKLEDKTIPFDYPMPRVSRNGVKFTSTYHRLQNGLEARLRFDSYTIYRRILQTGARTCIAEAVFNLRPGFDLFEGIRISNLEKFYSRNKVLDVRCEIPALLN